MRRLTVVRLRVVPLVAFAAALCAVAFPAGTASAGCSYSYWRVTAQTLSVRYSPGGTAFDTLRTNDTWVGPVGQGGAAWVLGSGIHRNRNPQTTTGRGYVLHQYLDYQGTAC